MLASDCAKNATEIKPQLNEETMLRFTKNLEEAGQIYVTLPNADNAIWYARRKGYLGHYKDAIEALTIAHGKFPKDARILRHRGHRYITLRCFNDAIKDLEAAAKLVRGRDDEVEPDGLPNALNIPTSTLQSNIWYHLGLAYYLKADWKNALRAYREAEKVSKNTDMLAATTHWLYMTLRRMERNPEAEKVLRPIDGNFEVIENGDYLRLLRMYRGEVKPEAIETLIGEGDSLGNASLGYGLGNWYLYNRDRTRAKEIFERIVRSSQWASFGFIAAEAELARK